MEAIADAFTNDSYRDERKRVNGMLNEIMTPCSEMICEKVRKEEWNSL